MKNKGFTLVEVLVSVALLGIVAIILAKFFQYNEIINEQTKFNQTKLYEAQDIMEKRISSINKSIEDGTAPVTSDYYENPLELTYNIFGKKIECYGVIGESFDSSSNVVCQLYTAIPKVQVKVKPALPQISDAELKINSAKPEVVYFSEGKTANASAKPPTDAEQLKNYKKNLYQWYITDNRYHAITTGEYKYMVSDVPFQYEYPRLPSDFGMITSSKEDNYIIKKEDLGKVLACSVTAGGKTGHIGNTLSTNHVYLSPLPELKSGEYQLLIDPSVNTKKMQTDISTKKIYSEKPTTNITDNYYFNSYASSFPSIAIESDTISLDVTDTTIQYKTRYLHFKDDNKITNYQGDISKSYNSKIYIVAKSKNPLGSNSVFMQLNGSGKNIDILKFDEIMSKAWCIYEVDLSKLTTTDYYKLELGCNDLCVAELLVVNNPNADDAVALVDYFNTRYGNVAKTIV